MVGSAIELTEKTGIQTRVLLVDEICGSKFVSADPPYARVDGITSVSIMGIGFDITGVKSPTATLHEGGKLKNAYIEINFKAFADAAIFGNTVKGDVATSLGFAENYRATEGHNPKSLGK
jgi:hypothetical protein